MANTAMVVSTTQLSLKCITPRLYPLISNNTSSTTSKCIRHIDLITSKKSGKSIIIIIITNGVGNIFANTTGTSSAKPTATDTRSRLNAAEFG